MQLKELIKNPESYHNFIVNWQEYIYAILLSGFASSLFLPLLLTNIFTILLIVFTTIILIKRKSHKFKNEKIRLLISISLYTIYVIGIIYSDNIQEGLSSLEAKLSLLLFPIIFYYNDRLSQNNVNKVLTVFVISANIAALFCLVKSIYLNYDLLATNSPDWEKITYHNLSGVIGFHAIYLSMYVCFALIIIMLRWSDKNGAAKVYYTVSWLFLSVFLLLLSARIVLVAFLLITLISTTIYAYKKHILQKLFLLYGFGLIIMTTIIINIEPLQDRIKEAINYKSEYSIDKHWGGRGLRLLKWQCCSEVIKHNPIIGVGTGSEQDRLQECYIENDYTPLLFWPNVKYNAHNQYLQTTLGIGTIGLIILFTNLILSLIVAVKEKQPLFICFIVIISICFITESMLQTNKGIVFYSFFNSFFLFSIKRK